MNNNQQIPCDQELIQRVQAGDRDAFSIVYRTYFVKLCNFSHRFIDINSVCEELVQDLFLTIWKNRRKWSPKDTIQSYLYKSIKNRILDYRKHQAIEAEYLKDRKKTEDQERRLILDHRLLYEEDEDLACVIDEAIESLPERRKLIFKLSREDGLTYLEIATILNISVKTVETQMGRSLKALRKLLANYVPGLTVLYHHFQIFF